MATRWRWPPDKSLGLRDSRWSMPRVLAACMTRRSISSWAPWPVADQRPCCRTSPCAGTARTTETPWQYRARPGHIVHALLPMQIARGDVFEAGESCATAWTFRSPTAHKHHKLPITDMQVHVAQNGHIAICLAYTGQLHIRHVQFHLRAGPSAQLTAEYNQSKVVLQHLQYPERHPIETQLSLQNQRVFP